jgi:hypothetical protein
VTVLAIAGTVQTAARLWYYGDVVPNTYYLKITGIPLAVRAARGVWVLGQFVWNANLLLFVLPFALLLRGDRRITLMLWIVVAQVAYSVYVGGDAWEYWGGSNRFICPVMPAFFVLLTYVLNLLAAALPAAIRGNRPFAASERYAVALFVFAVAAAMVSLNSIHGPAGLAEAALLRPPLHAGEGGENQMDVEQALALRDVTAPGATVAVVRAGTIPYFAGRTAIDLLGKNDRYVAHEPPRLSGGFLAFRDFRPGHVKFDFAYSIGRLEPDVILQLRQREEAATPFLQDYDDALLNGARIYVRRGSANVFRDRLHAGPD